MRLNTSTDPQVGYRPPGTLAPDALERYRGHFGARHAAHLLRRAGFGGTPEDVAVLAALGADAALDRILHPSGQDVAFDASPDAVALYDVHLRIRNQAAQMWFLDRMLRTKQPLAAKMTLFWHGHFATSLISSKVTAAQMVQQIALFQAEGLGNFGSLLRAVTYDPAMLVWLDNRKNVAAHPNENYARELMELFTLGLGNYSEDDVKNAARALTGITLTAGNHVAFNPKLHDDGEKTLLGHSGALGPDDVVAIVLEQPVHQRFLSRKLLEYFLYSDPEPDLIEGVAAVYATSGYDLAKTVAAILRSNVFFSERAYRALPKSPIEFVIGLQRYMRFERVPLDTLTWLERMGQIPLMPQTVKGWDGGPTWINTTTMLARMNYVNEVVQAHAGPNAMAAPANGRPNFPSDLKGLRDPSSILAAAGGMRAERVLDVVVDGLVQQDVTSQLRATLLDYLNGTNADNPQPFGAETFETRTRGLLALVSTLPAYNLN